MKTTGQPNILVIMTDQQKATASHLYGNVDCITPSLERLADDGIRYENAFTPHPLCVPARCSLWTSQYSSQNGCQLNQTLLRQGQTHAFRIWKEAGYFTGLIGKNHCFSHADDLSLFDVFCGIGHRGLTEERPAGGLSFIPSVSAIHEAHAERKRMCDKNDRLLSYAATDHPLEHYGTSLVGEQTVRFLRAAGDRPFALWASFPDPHFPWELPRRYFDLFSRDKLDLPPQRPEEFDGGPMTGRVLHRILNIRDQNEAEQRAVLAAYYGMIRFVDDQVGRILDELERLGLREKTIVVFCSDHGDFMLEHGMVEKGGLFHDCLTRVPMIFSWPGTLRPGLTVEGPVSLMDIVPTLLALQRLPIPPSMQGKPLPGALPVNERPYVFAEYGAGGPAFTLESLRQIVPANGRLALMRTLLARESEGRRKMARGRRWKYVHDPDAGQNELYDLKADPWELFNLAGAPAYGVIESEMKGVVLDWMAGIGAPEAIHGRHQGCP